eukprot:322561-Hanusia_phi.AAC.1
MAALKCALAHLSAISNVVPNYERVKDEIKEKIRSLGEKAAFSQDLSDLESPTTPDPSVASPIKAFGQFHLTDSTGEATSAKPQHRKESAGSDAGEAADEFDSDSMVRVVYPTRKFIQVRGMLARSNELVKFNEQIAHLESELEAIRIKKKFNADQIAWKHEVDRITRALINKVKASRVLRWGDVPENVHAQLTFIFRHGLMLLPRPAAFFNEMAAYILSEGSDWDSLVQTLSLRKETAEAWTGQPRSRLTLRASRPADELLWDTGGTDMDETDYGKEEESVVRDLERVKRLRRRLLLLRGLRSVEDVEGQQDTVAKDSASAFADPERHVLERRNDFVLGCHQVPQELGQVGGTDRNGLAPQLAETKRLTSINQAKTKSTYQAETKRLTSINQAETKRLTSINQCCIYNLAQDRKNRESYDF